MPKVTTKKETLTFTHEGQNITIKDGQDVSREDWNAALMQDEIKKRLQDGRWSVEDTGSDTAELRLGSGTPPRPGIHKTGEDKSDSADTDDFRRG